MRKVRKADDEDEADRIVDEIIAGVTIYDWAELAEITKPILDEVFTEAGSDALIQLSISDADALHQVNERGLAFAEDRSAELVGMKWVDGELVENPNAAWSITSSTRDMLRTDIADAIEEGDSAATLAATIEENYAFSELRSEMIARTELIGAHAQGNLAGWKASGVVKTKAWLLGSEHTEANCDGSCDDNADDGEIPIDATFSSGEDAPPAHPNCVCAMIAGVAEAEGSDDDEGDEVAAVAK